MNEKIRDNTTDTEQEDLQNLSFEELLARSWDGGRDQFQMRIEVRSKTVTKVPDREGRLYIEIAVDYVTVPRGKQKTKRTRLFFPDGQLIWENISDEPGIHYRVTLTRSSLDRRYYDWTEIVRLDDDNDQSALLNALSVEDQSELGAANEPTFEHLGVDESDPTPSNGADTPTLESTHSGE